MDAARPHSLRAHLSTPILRSHHHCPPAKLNIWCLRIVCCLVFGFWCFSSIPGYRLVQVENHPANLRPCSQFGFVSAFRFGREADARQFLGFVGIFFVMLPLKARNSSRDLRSCGLIGRARASSQAKSSRASSELRLEESTFSAKARDAS